jgi:hypothetical protein
MWSGLDDEMVIEQAREMLDYESQLSTDTEHVTQLSREDQAFLASGGPAATKLLETLKRGLEATTPELDDAIEEKLRKAGLH